MRTQSQSGILAHLVNSTGTSMATCQSLIEVFEQLSDPRARSGKRYPQKQRRGIKNGSHRQLDGLWVEDRQRMKSHTPAHVPATLRQICLIMNRKQQQERKERTQKNRP